MGSWEYRYKAKVVRVVDGDTLVLLIDLGFHTYIQHTIRAYNYSAPELNTQEGKDERFRLRKLFEEQSNEVLFVSHLDKPDKYGRLLGNVYHNGVLIL